MNAFERNLGLASSTVVSRGQGIFLSGGVRITSYDGDLAEAIVKGSNGNAYAVKIRFRKDGTVRTSSCSCPYDYPGLCKHRVAVLFALEENAPVSVVEGMELNRHYEEAEEALLECINQGKTPNYYTLSHTLRGLRTLRGEEALNIGSLALWACLAAPNYSDDPLAFYKKVIGELRLDHLESGPILLSRVLQRCKKLDYRNLRALFFDKRRNPGGLACIEAAIPYFEKGLPERVPNPYFDTVGFREVDFPEMPDRFLRFLPLLSASSYDRVVEEAISRGLPEVVSYLLASEIEETSRFDFQGFEYLKKRLAKEETDKFLRYAFVNVEYLSDYYLLRDLIPVDDDFEYALTRSKVYLDEDLQPYVLLREGRPYEIKIGSAPMFLLAIAYPYFRRLDREKVIKRLETRFNAWLDKDGMGTPEQIESFKAMVDTKPPFLKAYLHDPRLKKKCDENPALEAYLMKAYVELGEESDNEMHPILPKGGVF